MKTLFLSAIKEFLRAGIAAVLAVLGLSAAGCTCVPMIF